MAFYTGNDEALPFFSDWSKFSPIILSFFESQDFFLKIMSYESLEDLWYLYEETK